jgi:hypothetical protein
MTTTRKAGDRPPSSLATQDDGYTDATGKPVPADHFENEIEPRDPPLKGDALKDFDAETERLRKQKR